MTKHILVVDDEERIREVVQACLEDIGGWTTTLASSAAEGLALASAKPIDAILLDVSMPDMDGLMLFQRLQAQETTRSIPVIFLTAKVLPDDKAQFAEVGIAGLITKPFNPIALVEEIAEILKWRE